MSLLHILDHWPLALLTARAADLFEILPGPTLIHLPGRRPEPLFVSILLHGNEDVGLRAVQRLLEQAPSQSLPRALSIFVGNVSAARHNVRRLDGQPDYNRVWPGSDGDGTSEHAMMREVVTEMKARRVFASVDLHNNTGINPHYGCVSRLEHAHLQLASLFSRTVVYFRVPHGVQTRAFSDLCPAVTCECGKVGDPRGVSRAAEFLGTCLHLAEVPVHRIAPGDVHLFHTVATVTIPPGTSFSFSSSQAALQFPHDLESLNFQELETGALLARRRAGTVAKLIARDETGADVSGELLEFSPEAIRLRRPVMPSMLTCNEQVIQQDCLCYFMERFPLPA
ncbi:MAG: M14 family metallopeptidase [Planctomycetales bacterium]